MTDHVRIRSWVKASDAEVRTGLLGYISVCIAGFVIDGITVRRTVGGRLTLSYPARTDRSGRRHAIVRPADDEARRAIEAKILGELGQWGEAS